MAAKRVVRRPVWLCHHCGAWWPERTWPLSYYLSDEARDREDWPICPRPVCQDDAYPLDALTLIRRRGVQSPHLRGWTYTRETHWPLFELLRRGRPLERYPT